MKSFPVRATLLGLLGLGVVGTACAQGTGSGPAADPTSNGGNTAVNRGAGSGTGTEDDVRGTAGKPKAAPTENGGNATVNKGGGSGTGTAKPNSAQ